MDWIEVLATINWLPNPKAIVMRITKLTGLNSHGNL